MQEVKPRPEKMGVARCLECRGETDPGRRYCEGCEALAKQEDYRDLQLKDR